MALLPAGPPKRLRGVDWPRASRRHASSAAISTISSLLKRAGSWSRSAMSRGRASAALYSAFAGELLRGRTFRNRYMAEKATPPVC